MNTQEISMTELTDSLIRSLSVFMRRAGITERELEALSNALDVLVRVKLDEFS